MVSSTTQTELEMNDSNLQIRKLNPALGLVGDSSFIYVLRFTSDHHIFVDAFCDQAQTILYDDMGSSGHFRMAPLRRSDLHENFILGVRSDKPAEFMQRNDNELFVAFLIRTDDPDNPVSKECLVIPDELDDFCEAVGLRWEQLDVRELYRDH
jgi:hypothetical protein